MLARLEERVEVLERDSHPEQAVIPAATVTQMVAGLNDEILALRRRVLALEDPD